MVSVKPFRGLRPLPDKVGDVASPPYDVLNSQEAREKVKDNPDSFLRVVKPEIDLDPTIDIYDPQVYAKGAENLKRLVDQGIMKQDESPCYYVYKLIMDGREQIGLVCASSVEDYNNNKIKKHEFTRPDKENDRVCHIDHLNAQTGPVFLTYRQSDEVDALMDEAMKKDPVYDFVGDYEVRHVFYVVDDPSLIDKIEGAFSRIDALYVADGHHRSASASRVQAARKEKNPEHTGNESYNYFLSVVFPDNQMLILDYNRVVKDLNGLSEQEFLVKLSEKFDVTPFETCCCCSGGSAYKPERMHHFGMYMNGQWYVLTALDGSFDTSDPIDQLDVSILQKNILTPVLGIEDPRTDKRIHFVGGIRGLCELEKLVNGGEYAVAFSMFPTSIGQLLSVADANQVMPPKSTWFEPKLRSGVVVHLLD